MGNKDTKSCKEEEGQEDQDQNSESHDRPSTPPRELASILKSTVLTNDFRTFLADLDEDAGEGDNLRVTWLNFVLRCRELKSLRESGQDVRHHLRRMESDFFSDHNRVVLSSNTMWTSCKKYCQRGGGRSGDPMVMWRAHDDVIRQLEDIHQPFLVEKNLKQKNSLPDVIQQCLL